MEQKLATGRQWIQFHAEPSVDGMSAKLQLRSGEEEQIQNSDLPFKLRDQQPGPAIVNVLDAQKSVRLLERPLEGSEQSLSLDVLLVRLSDIKK